MRIYQKDGHNLSLCLLVQNILLLVRREGAGCAAQIQYGVLLLSFSALNNDVESKVATKVLIK